MDSRRQDAVALPRPRRQDLTMLDDGLKAQLQGYLERLQQPVEILASLDEGDGAREVVGLQQPVETLASLDESDGSREMLELLNAIVTLSPRVTLEARRDDEEIKPS